MKKLNVILAVLAVTVLSCGLAQATPLAPGTSVAPGATTQPPPGGVLVATLLGSPFANGTLSGTIDSFVYSTPGGLDFVYQIHNTGTSQIERFTATPFGSLLTDVNTATTAAGQVNSPLADRDPTGNVVGFAFPQNGPFGAITAGKDSFFLNVQTNGLFFQAGTGNVIDGTIASARILVPNLPDGGSALALLGMALTGIEFFRRKLKAT